MAASEVGRGPVSESVAGRPAAELRPFIAGYSFAAEIGLTPKAAARVVRFDRARRLLQRRAAASRPLDLAALAAYCGYYDQAHLDAEFRVLAGAPPTTWLAREFRNLQASPAAAGEG